MKKVRLQNNVGEQRELIISLLLLETKNYTHFPAHIRINRMICVNLASW